MHWITEIESTTFLRTSKLVSRKAFYCVTTGTTQKHFVTIARILKHCVTTAREKASNKHIWEKKDDENERFFFLQVFQFCSNWQYLNELINFSSL